jgi:Tfp pilus assembly PilM family ATPase
MPGMQEGEILDALKWQHSSEEAGSSVESVIGFSVLQEVIKDDGSAAVDLVYAACPKEEIAQEVLLLKDAGLTCLAVVPSAFGYAAYLERFVPEAKGVLSGVLHIGEDLCYLGVCLGGRLEFYRELPISLKKFRESLLQVLVSDKGKVELTLQEADEALFKIGVPQSDAVFKDKLNSSQLLSLIRTGLERLVAEINRSFNYYASQFSAGEVTQLFICGKAASMPNLDTFLAKELSLKVRAVPLPANAVPAAGVDPELLRQSCADLGLSAGFQGLPNLLPFEFRAERFERLQKLSLRWFSFTVFGFLILSFIFAKVGISIYQNRLMLAGQHLTILSEVSRLKGSSEEFEGFIASVRNKEPRIEEIMQKLSSVAPASLFLSSLALNAATKEFTLEGIIGGDAKNPDALLNQFVAELKSLPYFSDADIGRVEKEDVPDGVTAKNRFSVNFKLR